MPAHTELLDALAALLRYPDDGLPRHARACLAASTTCPAAGAALQRFADEIAGASIAALQEQYTETFDMSPTCALDVGWHLFGDTHKRGGFMAGLGEDLRRAGVGDTGELPDHLTQVLALLGREEAARASALAEVVAPAIATVRRALDARKSPYAHVLAAVQDAVGGLRAEREEVTRP